MKDEIVNRVFVKKLISRFLLDFIFQREKKTFQILICF